MKDHQNEQIRDFTAFEMQLMSDDTYPLAKKAVIEKVQHQFHILGEVLAEDHANIPGLSNKHYKISKGENYLDLPYMVLDFPKISGKGFRILFRTMFWWGRYYSFNVFIKKELVGDPGFMTKMKRSDLKDILVLGTDNLWNQDLENGEFIPLNQLNEEGVKGLEYLKISKIHPLKKPAELMEEAVFFYKNIAEIVSSGSEGSF